MLSFYDRKKGNVVNGISRAGRKAQIIEALQGKVGGLTTYEICQKIGLAYSAHARGIVYEMYDNGELARWETVKPNGMKVYFFYSKEVVDEFYNNLQQLPLMEAYEALTA